MSAGTKATWETNAKASGLNLPGYHFFLREAQRDLLTHHGLMGYWHMNEIVGGKIKDISGANQDGTLEPSYPSNAPVLVPSQHTRFGSALSFDGVDDRVNFGNVCNSPKSIEMVAKIYTIAESSGILDKTYWDPNSGYALAIEKDGSDYFLYAWIAANWRLYQNINAYLDEWHIYTWTFGPSDWYLYIDGTEVKTDVRSIDPISSTPRPLYLGYDLNLYENPTHGILDELCIYNRVLSAAEVATRYKIASSKL